LTGQIAEKAGVS